MSQDRSGLSYKKTDLHVHTPASHDFINKDITEEDIINHCISIGLDAIAITDHNTGEYIVFEDTSQKHLTNPILSKPVFLKCP